MFIALEAETLSQLRQERNTFYAPPKLVSKEKHHDFYKHLAPNGASILL